MVTLRETQMWQRIQETPQAMDEALAATAAQAEAFRALLTERTTVIFTGCGTSYDLALASAQYLHEQSAWTRDAYAVSGAYLGRLDPRRDYLVIAPSRSGRTVEVVEQLTMWKRELPTWRVVSITTDRSSPLATMSDLAIVIPSGQEHLNVQTKSMNALLLSLRYLVASYCGATDQLAVLQDLPAQIRQLAGWEPEDDLARYDSFEFAGDTAQTLWTSWVASGASLSMAEISGVVAKGYSSLNYRHGPMSRCGPGTFMTVMSDIDDRLERLIREVEALGATVARPTPRPLGGRIRVDPQIELYKTHLRAVQRGLLAGRPVDEAPGVLPYVATI